MNNLVSIIVVTWNGKELLKSCLTSIYSQSYKNIEVILVDNASSDNSVSFIKNKFPKVKIIVNKENAGFCKANNMGYKASKGDYVLFLNNDTLVTKNFLEPLIEKLGEKKNNGIVQPKIILYGNRKLQAGGAFFTNTGFLYHFGFGKNPDDPKYNIPMQIFSANGSCMLVKREVIEKIGLFDEDYFIYMEETDFCHRALLTGYQVWYESKAVIYHLGSMDNSQYKQSVLLYNSFRNRITTYLKNLEVINLVKILPLTIILYLFAVIIYLGLGKPGNSLAVIKALFYNIIHLDKTLRKRKTIQSQYRQLNDKKFLPTVTRNPRLDYYLKLFSGLENYQD